MNTTEKTKITVTTAINAPIEKVWEFWANPEHIIQWNNPSEDWHTTKAVNDLQRGGKFLSRMEAKDGSMGFDFSGVYDDVIQKQLINYTLDDGRKVKVIFTTEDHQTNVITTFEAENQNPLEMQKDGWQAILTNFKKYVEAV